MAKGKSLGLKKFVIKFYAFFWDLIEEDFFKMIDAMIKEGCLPNRVNKSSITHLNDWCPTILLNIFYKSFVKML
jgi:hypothetical protein